MICINTRSEEFLIYHKLKLENLKDKILKYLNMPDIDITYDMEARSQYSWNHILIGRKFQIKFNITNKILGINLKTYEDGLIFALCHELGHHFHVTKHRTWTDQFLSQYDFNLEDAEKYNRQRIEQVANNIAKILLKKFHAQVLTNP